MERSARLGATRIEMSLTPNHRKSQSPWVDLGIFAAVLAFLAYSAQATLGFAIRPATKQTISPITATQPVAEPPRMPASAAGPSPAYRNKGATEVLRLPCLHHADRTFGSEARLLQIHAPACEDDLLHTASWKARNESSGEEIIVFVNTKEKTFSTSYFSLKEGVNKLVFTHDLRKGQAKTQRFEITRKFVE